MHGFTMSEALARREAGGRPWVELLSVDITEELRVVVVFGPAEGSRAG